MKQKYTKWTPALIDELRELTNQGCSNAEIGDILGLTIRTVNASKSRFAISREKKWTTADVLLIKQLREQGFTSAEIASHLGVSASAINGHINRSDLIPKRRYKSRSLAMQKISQNLIGG